LKGWE